MKRFLWLLLLLCPYMSMARQTPGLKVGDKVPNVVLRNITNYKKTTAKLYDFKSRLLLIDMWATTCAPCIREISMLDSLKQCFPGQLSVVAVNSLTDTKERLDKLLARLQLKLTIPMVLGNTELQSLFPHSAVPHFAWVDSNFNVMAITGGSSVTAERLANFLRSGRISFSEKDELVQFNKQEPLFTNGNGGDGKQLIARSTFSNYIYGIGSTNQRSTDSTGGITRVLLTNKSVEDLLMRAYNYAPETLRFKWEGIPITGEFCYELITPPITEKEMLRLFREDIARYLKLSAEIINDPAPTLFIHHLPN
ncbi:TlpA disulfide reductase family protein [Ferruginibacter sp. HRS2-29]|uniref:TlpA family protein disulfide reductase n=1 Tax=Ferruginibacter sp. HRS2-29 TaxID=2487334 RepID=UPI0020CB6CFB|nr:TlpA disulfide reductase family protein [Ferruginibacter sp. HRS2-29]MCP9749663.1 TlpA family protein disulfide reductase [Ferruginibacter sp. HRS2-29]